MGKEWPFADRIVQKHREEFEAALAAAWPINCTPARLAGESNHRYADALEALIRRREKAVRLRTENLQAARAAIAKHTAKYRVRFHTRILDGADPDGPGELLVWLNPRPLRPSRRRGTVSLSTTAQGAPRDREQTERPRPPGHPDAG